jgi:phospholipid/cholesterol/gamma-HCH transport system permease protein
VEESQATQAAEKLAPAPQRELAFFKFLRGEGERIELLLRTLHRISHVPKRRRLIYEQMFLSGIQTLHVVLLVGLFIGMIVSLQTGIELAKLGQQDQIGTIVAVSMAREMGPFITAIVLAATVGSAIAAELGTMSVSNELEALKVMSIDRLSLLVLPRLIALAVIAPLLTLVCDTVGIVGGAFVANAQLNVGFEMYMTSAIDALRPTGFFLNIPKDLYAGLIKAVVFGGMIATISCNEGLKASGGALGVGRATRSSVRDAIIGVIVINYFMTWFMYQA